MTDRPLSDNVRFYCDGRNTGDLPADDGKRKKGVLGAQTDKPARGAVPARRLEGDSLLLLALMLFLFDESCDDGTLMLLAFIFISGL